MEEPLIRVEEVWKTYSMGVVQVHALRGLSLDIRPGEFVVLVGPSGSGKTTLINLLGGLDRPTRGRIWVDGEELTAFDEVRLTEYRRRKVGFVFQFFNLIPTLTALENVELVAELVPGARSPWEVLAAVGLADRAHHFPVELSGGEQQRVAIARALVKNPSLLLADEPTGNLDYETARQVLRVMKDIQTQERMTMVLVTHNAAIARLAHRIVRIRSGQVVEVRENPRPAEPEELEW